MNIANSMAWLEGEYPYSYYVESCRENNIEAATEDSDEFLNWQVTENQLDFQCTLDNIMYSSYRYDDFVIEGTIGAWDGRHGIMPVLVTGLYEAIIKCITNSDDADIELDEKSGAMYVNAHDHDGTSSFTIRKLRSYCRNAYDRALDEYHYGDANTFEVKDGWFQKIKLEKLY